VTFPTLAHGNFNVLEGLLPELAGVTAVQPWSEGGPAARGGYQTIAQSVVALLDKVLQGAPGDGSLAAGDVRQPGHVRVPVTFTRHGPGRGVSATAGTAFVDDTVVVESDGWRLVGNMVRPGAGNRTAAVLLLNKANGDRRVYAPVALELARRGVSSLRLDLRGHGESTNLATFVPWLANAADAGEERDIAAALRWLRSHRFVDSTRIGVVGASYSGEAAAVAARAGDGARAYVALSPGSLSERTVADIDASRVPWFIVASANERFLRGVIAMVRDRSRTATIAEMDGGAHASDILVTHPELAGRIADWLVARLE
jgi:dienelactone hydrolase